MEFIDNMTTIELKEVAKGLKAEIAECREALQENPQDNFTQYRLARCLEDLQRIQTKLDCYEPEQPFVR